jgi:hypothetical protein
LEENYKAIHAENYSLREYIIRLQSRLIESQGEFPQPPPNINLSHSSTHPHPQQRQHESLEHMQRQHDGAPVAPMGQIGNTIQASRTIAAAGLKHSGDESQQYNQQPETKRFKEDDANDENLIRSQLTADGLPPPGPL